MINLDDIGGRIGRGQFTAADVQTLATEAASLKVGDPQVINRVGLGFAGAAEANSLFSAVEQAYSDKFGRPTFAQQRAADLAAQDAAIVSANASRFAASQAQAIADVTAANAWQATSQTVQASQATAIATKATLEKFNAAKAAADAQLADKAKKKQDLENILNG